MAKFAVSSLIASYVEKVWNFIVSLVFLFMYLEDSNNRAWIALYALYFMSMFNISSACIAATRNKFINSYFLCFAAISDRQTSLAAILL